MQFKSSSFLLTIFCFFLQAYEITPESIQNNYQMPQVEIQVNNSPSPSNWHISGQVRKTSDYTNQKFIDYTVLQQASPGLKEYFASIIAPHFYDAFVNNHCIVISGYEYPNGLRDCIQGLSQFSVSDGLLIPGFVERLKTYDAFAEKVLFSGKDHAFCENISCRNQKKLLAAYADFLKEFYPKFASYIFSHQSQKNLLMQQVIRSIDWKRYNGNNVKSSSKQIAQRYAAAVNGNLGVVYKAFHDGDSEKAYTLGQQRIAIVLKRGKIEYTSVFEKYPALKVAIEKMYFADQAKIQQARIAQQNAVQQEARIVNGRCAEGIQLKALIPSVDILQSRSHAAQGQIKDPGFFTKLHSLVTEQATRINIDHLTADQKGILLDGGHLQHHNVDEAITIVDVAISVDLVENVQDAIIDLANISLTLNKDGEVVKAVQVLDACWSLIDYGKKAAHYTYAVLSTHIPLAAEGVRDGVAESLHGAMHTICHPIQAAQDAAISLATAGYCLGQAAYKAGEYEGIIDLMETQPQLAQEMLAKVGQEPSTLVALCEHVQTLSTKDVAKEGTKIVIDMMLLQSASKVASTLASGCVAEFMSCLRKGEQSSEILLTAENIQVKCGEEIASVLQKMESTQKIGGGTKIIQESLVKKIRSVGDDILDIMEKIGGHTLERHVAKTPVDLVKRMVKDPVITSASSFTNKRTAINAVKESLKHNAEKIAVWVKDPLLEQIVIEFSHSHPIGSIVSKVKKNPLYNVTNSRMILKKDLTQEFGFKIITAFPIV